MANKFFINPIFSKDSFRNTIRVSNSLDPDQAGHFEVPDLGPNCLQMTKVATSRQRVKNNLAVPGPQIRVGS